jgi:hypothetical protein
MDAVADRSNNEAFFEWTVKSAVSNHKGTAALVLIEGGVNQDTRCPTASFSKWITAVTGFYIPGAVT